MHIPHPDIPFVVCLHPVQALCSGRGGESNVTCIRCLSGWVPKAFELWALSENRVREVHPSARVKLLDNFRENIFHTHFFNARRFQIPFLGHRSVNMSVEFLDGARATQQVGSRVATWTENIFVHSCGPYPNMIPHTFSTIKRRVFNVPVTPRALVLRSNHEHIRLKRVEWRQTHHR